MAEERGNFSDDFFEEEEDALKDRYLTFHLAGEDYAIEIYYVTEIIGIEKITQVPDTEDYIKGVINLRGKVIPVIDVRLRFHFKELEYGDRTCIIVVNVDDVSTGLIVDEVSEVIELPSNQIDPPPKTGKSTKGKFIKGMGKYEDNVIIILDAEKLLSEEELEELKSLSEG